MVGNNIRKWSTTATANATVAGGANTINFAEGQNPSTVNNSAREMMAQIRGWYTPAEAGWVDQSNTASIASQTVFKLSGDQTANWTANRRWRLRGGSTTRYGSVVSSSFTAETTITVTVDSGSLSASHSIAALAAITSDHIPANTYLTSASAATALALKQPAILFKDEGASLSSAAAVSTIDIVGAGVSASLTTGLLTLTVSATDTGNVQTFTSSGTWTKPSGKGSTSIVLIKVWGAGGSGGKGSANAAQGGGGGGGYNELITTLGALGATETVTIGDGGAAQTSANTAGNVGGDTTFGAHLTGYGGGGGGFLAGGGGGGGGGGGTTGAGSTSSGAMGGTGGFVGSTLNNSGGNSSVSGATQANFLGSGGGGAATDNAGANGSGGDTFWGGAGGGAGAEDSSPGPGSGGVSIKGGNGGAGAFDASNATDGSQPGGGGGGSEAGNSGAGGKGQCIVYVF